MFIESLLGLVVIAGADMRLFWGEPARQTVTLDAGTFSESASRCLESGREARFRFELRGCRRRVGWFDTCGGDYVWTKGLQYDPITESYRLSTDRLNDEGDPVSVGIANREEALRRIVLLDSIPVKTLQVGGAAVTETRRGYFGARVIYECKGLVSRTWARLTMALTLGLVEVGSTDTGWKDFDPQLEIEAARASPKLRLKRE